MVVAGVVKRSVYSEISIKIAHMIGYHINHHQNVFGMACLDQVYKIFLTSKIRVEFV